MVCAASKRPEFVTLYMEGVDTQGHLHGPASDEVRQAMKQVDDALGMLLNGLSTRNMTETTNIIVVSDHGMTGISSDRLIFVDDYLDLNDVYIVDWTPILQIIPNPGKEDDVYNALYGAHPNMAVYRKGETPSRYHFSNNRRITPILGVADLGWSITSRSYLATHPSAFVGKHHGW